MAMADHEVPQYFNRLQLTRARSWLVVSNSFGQSHLALALGAFLTGYALYLGASVSQIGVLGALAALAAILQVVSPSLSGRLSRRAFCFVFWISGYAVWVPVILIPWLVPPSAQVWVLLALIEAGMSREKAYEIVQRNSMKGWDEGLDFRDLIRGESQVLDLIPSYALEELFDYAYYARYVDETFQRAGV